MAEATLKLIETTISGKAVRLLYANAATKDQATEWVEMLVTSEGDDNRRLGVIQKEALLRLRALIVEENKRFEALAGRLGG